MSFTNCCNHEFIGDNHSPIRPDGYCLHCGFHPEIESLKAEIGIYKANERLMQMRLEDLKEANKVLREAVEFYGDEEEGKVWGSLDEQYDIIHPSDIEGCIGGKRARQALAKADEIMGEKK